ncbi:ABC transporter ATP-binding protein [Natrarchaeobius sp. A-rgal3]|uniref:ABC transporter ATP-binding protein n=1 Tax=Natrarchaeobius versutus TaxID=1679078 RepID=UPI00350E9B27
MSSEPVTGASSASSTVDIIELEDLRKEYPGVVAVDDVDLHIREGEFFTLLGPSGSGKSTLLQLIAGIETPTSGELRIRGERVNDVKAYNRNTSMVFQEYALFPHMTAQENVEYGLMLRGVDEQTRAERAGEMFEMMGLAGKEDRQVTELSGGERQRVATARSLVVEPDVLLLDEVLGALDEKLSKEMQIELKNLQQTVDKTFLFVTHSQEEAFTMSDRIAIMHDGDVAQVGKPLDIYKNPNSEFVADFLGVSNIISGTVTDVSDQHLVIESEGITYRVSTAGIADVPAEGEEIGFFVPNEQVVIGAEAANANEAVVADTVFKGPHTQYVLELENGSQLHAHETTGETLIEEGSSVTVGFEPSTAKLLR